MIKFSFFDVMTSDALLGPHFSGASWNTWRVVMKALDCEKLSADEMAVFHEIAGNREPPSARVQELVVAAGRGAGKDAMASALAAAIALNFDGRGILRPGENGTILCVANDRDQAGILFRYIRGYFEEVPALARLVVSIGTNAIELVNRVTIEVGTNTIRAPRGKRLLCCIMDECAFFRGDESVSSSDVEVDAAISPGLARTPGSLKILISSVNKRSGILYDKCSASFGKDDADTLVVMGGTLTFNPTFPAATIEKDIARDPARFSAEYHNIWRDDLSSWITRDILDSAVDRGVMVRPPQEGKQYFAGADASGGRNDSFTAAIAHRDNDGTIVLDALFERKSPFLPSEVVADVCALITEYRCQQITGDNYGAQWTVEAFAKCGKTYVKSEQARSDVYLNTLPLLMSGQVRLLDNARMLSQFAALERQTFTNGRERINPGPMHDDVCNSAALALVAASGKGDTIETWIKAFVPEKLAEYHGQKKTQDEIAKAERDALLPPPVPMHQKNMAVFVPNPSPSQVQPRDPNGDPPAKLEPNPPPAFMYIK